MSERRWLTALKQMEACDGAVEWANSYATVPAAWDVCERADWMLWLLEKVKPKRTDLFPIAAAFVERALGSAATALESAAGVKGMPQASADSLRTHATKLRGLRVDSRAAAWAARAAAWAARAAAGAASAAAGAASAAAGAASDAAGAARAAAWAASAAAWAASDAVGAARAAAGAASDAAWAASDAAGAASDAAGAARDAAWAAEMKWQADYIRTQFACPVLK